MDEANDCRLIFRGAEAEVFATTFHGLPAVAKRRVAKAYRLPELDRRIRRERTKLEAHVTQEARAAGVRAPRVFDVDLARAQIVFEFVQGPSLRQFLHAKEPNALDACTEFGRLVGRLHESGYVHGDLTTSNVLTGPEGPVLIDFGLASRSDEVEYRGVDLHLIERTFASTHPERDDYFDAFQSGYAHAFGGSARALERMNDIKTRARYA